MLFVVWVSRERKHIKGWKTFISRIELGVQKKIKWISCRNLVNYVMYDLKSIYWYLTVPMLWRTILTAMFEHTLVIKHDVIRFSVKL